MPFAEFAVPTLTGLIGLALLFATLLILRQD